MLLRVRPRDFARISETLSPQNAVEEVIVAVLYLHLSFALG